MDGALVGLGIVIVVIFVVAALYISAENYAIYLFYFAIVRVTDDLVVYLVVQLHSMNFLRFKMLYRNVAWVTRRWR